MKMPRLSNDELREILGEIRGTAYDNAKEGRNEKQQGIRDRVHSLSHQVPKSFTDSEVLPTMQVQSQEATGQGWPQEDAGEREGPERVRKTS